MPSLQPMADDNLYMLWCFVEGDVTAFPLTVHVNTIIANLKELVWSKRKNSILLRDTDAADLVLWKLTQPELITPSQYLPQRIGSRGNLSTFATKLQELNNTVLDEFPENPGTKHLHVIVQVPVAEDYPHKRLHMISPPHEPTCLIPRTDTVVALYQKLNNYRFIQVRGTPASGKTSLAVLIGQHIKHQEPTTKVIWIQGWSREYVEARGRWEKYLKTEKGWVQPDNTVFIFDEAQMTYNDGDLWHNFFKSIHSYDRCRVICFASYGSASSRVYIDGSGTPIFIKDVQRVTLRAIKYDDNLPPAGLFFTRKEFDDLHYSQKYCFDTSFFNAVYDLTMGHIGAIHDFIQIILADDSYRAIRNVASQPYTWSMFLEKVSPRALVEKLEKSASLFIRGLPPNYELQSPPVARIFSSVLSTGFVRDADITTKNDKDALSVCFRSGWLHTDKINNIDRPDHLGYFFPSPLHRWYVEWKLQDTLPAIPTFNAASVVELAIGVIAKFNPRRLSTERRIDSGGIQQPPEAQYQTEFYRSFNVYSNGRLITFPEYGTAKGRVDFYIPTKQWGVELLRDSDQLAEHSGRFSAGGKYNTTLHFVDYIILDCRTTTPKVAHPDLRNLYHVVFSDNYHNVRILNNKLKLVVGGEFSLPAD